MGGGGSITKVTYNQKPDAPQYAYNLEQKYQYAIFQWQTAFTYHFQYIRMVFLLYGASGVFLIVHSDRMTCYILGNHTGMVFHL